MPVFFKQAAFLPYVAMVFLNAMVDLGHKILIQNTLFKSYDGNEQVILTAIVNALILLPFILLFTPAGFIADRFPKNRVMRLSAWLAVGLTLCITLAYYLGWFWLAFGLTLLLAMQSAIYSPAKYGYIKELVGVKHLAPANGVVQAATTTAILLGIFLFSILFEALLSDTTGAMQARPPEILQQFAPLGWLLVMFSVFELLLAYRLPDRSSAVQSETFDWRRYRTGRYLRDNLGETWNQPVLRLAIIGLSVFWAVSQVVLAVFPAFAKEQLEITNTVLIQGMVASSGIGIVIGSVLAGRSSRAHIETGLIPVGASLMAVCLFLLPSINSVFWHAINFLIFGIAGGLFLVPLNALIQYHAGNLSAGRVLSANNFIQNVAMLSFLSLVVVAALAKVPSLYIVATLGFVATAGAIYTVGKLPQSLVRFLVARLLGLGYRMRVLGFDHLPQQGGVLLLGNHISWIDWAMVQIASPRQVRFVMERSIYELWYLRWFLDLFGVVPIARGRSREALQTIRDLLSQGEVVCLFPEGQISRNGQLAEFRSGYERAVEGMESDSGVVIVPFYLRGLWGTRFSRASDKIKRNRNEGLVASHEVIVAFGESLVITTGVAELKQAVTALSVMSWHQYAEQLPSLPRALISTLRHSRWRAMRGAANPALIDGRGRTTSLWRLLSEAALLAKHLPKDKRLALMLGNRRQAIVMNLALLFSGRPMLNLDYSEWQAQAQQAGVTALLTDYPINNESAEQGMSGPIEAGQEKAQIQARQSEIRIIDANVQANHPVWQIGLMGLALMLLPSRALLARLSTTVRPEASPEASPEDPAIEASAKHRHARQTAALMFTKDVDRLTGSDTDARLVIELSHQNILVNCRQIAEVMNLRESDAVLANLPIHQALSLTATTLLPLLEAVSIVVPRSSQIVADNTEQSASGNEIELAKSIARNTVSVLCATPEMLTALCENQRVYSQALSSLRYIVCTEPNVDEALYNAFLNKFHRPIFVGYGAVETTPVASLNLPDQLDVISWKMQLGHTPNTVGMPLPGTRFRITDTETGEERPQGQSGSIEIAGVQVMKGYLGNPEATRRRLRDEQGLRWFRSQQRGHINDKGFLVLEDEPA